MMQGDFHSFVGPETVRLSQRQQGRSRRPQSRVGNARTNAVGRAGRTTGPWKRRQDRRPHADATRPGGQAYPAGAGRDRSADPTAAVAKGFISLTEYVGLSDRRSWQ